MWRATERKSGEQFDCDLCDVKGWRRSKNPSSRRACFFDEEEIECEVLRLDDSLRPVPSKKKGQKYETERRIFTSTELLEYLSALEKALPGEPPVSPYGGGGLCGIVGIYSHYTEGGCGICPRSLIDERDLDDRTFEVLDLEGTCSAYNQLPCEGSVLEQPKSLRHAFTVIRGVKASFERDKFDDDQKRMESKSKSEKAKRGV